MKKTLITYLFLTISVFVSATAMTQAAPRSPHFHYGQHNQHLYKIPVPERNYLIRIGCIQAIHLPNGRIELRQLRPLPPRQAHYAPRRGAAPAPKVVRKAPRKKVAPKKTARKAPASTSKVNRLIRQCHILSRKRVPYVFGGTNPAKGLDCSSTMQYIHKLIGVKIPRNSRAQAAYLAERGTLTRVSPHTSQTQVYKSLRPGDLVFWANKGSTRVLHVMVFTGRTASGRYRMFGARGTGLTGLNGSGADFYDYRGRSGKRYIVGYGRAPGM